MMSSDFSRHISIRPGWKKVCLSLRTGTGTGTQNKTKSFEDRFDLKSPRSKNHCSNPSGGEQEDVRELHCSMAPSPVSGQMRNNKWDKKK